RAAADAGWWGRTPIGLAVLRYQECSALMRDNRLRHGSLDALAALGVTSGLFIDWLKATLLNVETQEHQRQRRLVSRAFTQRSIDALRPFMRAKAHELIDSFAGTGSCEFMTTFADPYPAWVIAELLGIPTDRFDTFLGWATDMGLGFSPDVATELDRIDAAVAGLYACCDELTAQRRTNPGDDLISTLIAAEADGGRLTAAELRHLVSGLVFAGQDTTRNQLGLAMTTFARHPEQWRLLAERPELADTAVEELMRVNPAVPVVARVAQEDFTFQGLDIPAGTHVVLFLAAANTEPDTFGDAPFDITAKRTAQLTFGGGMHYCLGAWLARIEMREALPILAARLGDIALGGIVSSRPHVGITGPITLPLHFTGAGRSGSQASQTGEVTDSADTRQEAVGATAGGDEPRETL
ncbi:MAG TPA: cytochrome P450, partial [Pseudonocardiaceae bacterium]|nr:cytochrome P450 [Pseudonocardiaceae bacterium]